MGRGCRRRRWEGWGLQGWPGGLLAGVEVAVDGPDEATFKRGQAPALRLRPAFFLRESAC